ncbi:hypothetical protein L218DRAFT_962953 [Marasmius fiardii PR-910]|nr:hypothetical protein L218DRAFT_962953 [Marasmius fiardii PR-910]
MFIVTHSLDYSDLLEDSPNLSRPAYDGLPSAWEEDYAGSSQHLLSSPEYSSNGSSDITAMGNYSPDHLPLQEAYDVHAQDSTCLEFGQTDDGANDFPTTPLTPNSYESQNTCFSSSPVDTDYNSAPSTPIEDTREDSSAEHGGVAMAISPTPKPYRSKVPSPKVLKASRGRRKRGGGARRGRLFKCEEPGCGSDFTSRQNLNNHLNAHYGIKPFSCEHCPKSFGTANDCKRHIRTCVAKKQNGLQFVDCGGLSGCVNE